MNGYPFNIDPLFFGRYYFSQFRIVNPKVLNVKYQEHYKLNFTFANKEVKEFDLSSYLDFDNY